MHYFSSSLTFDIIFIRNLWMFFQGWRDWRRNILKFFDKGCVFNNDCCFCILVSQWLKIAANYKCWVEWEQSEVLHHTGNRYEKQEECGTKGTAEQTLQKPVLGEETFCAQRRQQNSVSLRERKAAELPGPGLLEAGSYSLPFAVKSLCRRRDFDSISPLWYSLALTEHWWSSALSGILLC